jgi:hypothetical protein
MPKRAGRTVKLSISIDPQDFAILEKRAKRVSGGNISAAIAEMIHLAHEWEGGRALAAWIGEGRADVTEKDMDRVRAEWRGRKPARRREKAA